MLVIPDGYVQAALFHNLEDSSRQAVVTIGVKYGTGFGGGLTYQDIASGIAEAWAENVVGQMTDDISFVKCVIRVQDGIVGEVPVVGASGLRAQLGATHNTAFLVKKVTDEPGREHNGRMYVPGVAEADVSSSGRIVDSVKTDWQNALNGFFARTGTSEPEAVDDFVILHNSDQLDGAPAPTRITALSLDPFVATQRRRLRK